MQLKIPLSINVNKISYYTILHIIDFKLIKIKHLYLTLEVSLELSIYAPRILHNF